ncbi:Uncharacterised protein [Mycobacteroides abscessus subsp. massiliense]|nr:Uncharacterised protein [Mycobacteroides abscessus subsp. massiliense]
MTDINAVIERLEGRVSDLKKETATSLQYANQYDIPANWEAVAEVRGELNGIRLALSYLREEAGQ